MWWILLLLTIVPAQADQYVVIERGTNKVLNVIEWDGQTPYHPEGDVRIIPVPPEGVYFGATTYDGSKLVTPACHKTNTCDPKK